MKVQEYQVLTTSSLKQLNIDVNEYIQQGWQPFGGVCRNYIDKSFDVDYQESEYAQAMVIFEDQ